MPTAVAQKMRLAKGEGRILEPEEFDKLQKEGYINAATEGSAEADSEVDQFLKTQGIDAAGQAAEAAVQEAEHEMMEAEAKGEMDDPALAGRVAESKLHQVEIEEVEDEDY